MMEVLSDLVRQDGGLVVAQLKRTMSSGALHKALDELWSIDELCGSATPALRASLRYEVQAARAGLKNAAKSMANWLPPGKPDAAELAAFKARVDLVVTADPRLEAARLLVAHYADDHPFRTVDRFSGRLLRVEGDAAMVEASVELRIELDGLRARSMERQADYRLWGIDDRPPAQIVLEPEIAKAVRVGQRLTVADLITGRLADRRVYADIHAEAEAWLEEVAESSDKIPTFWIEGRSGAGKSAALLHLISKLHAEDPRRVIVWLGPRSHRLGEAIRRFSDVIGEGRQLIIAIDDPLAPAQQGQFATAVQEAADHWVNLASRGAGGGPDGVAAPVLICCGPTEQREFGEDRYAAELDIRDLPLPHESAEDLAELADWYEARTGTAPPHLTGDVLLVQRFFEWNEGDVREFALRFKARLDAFPAQRRGTSVFEAVARILAFGRLYADYPAAALRLAMDADDALGKAFDQLSKTEAHLEFLADGDGVRLTHPHLADAIYRVWFGRPGDDRARKRHLADGLRAAARSDVADPEVRFAPFWAIARLLKSQRGGRAELEDAKARINLIEVELMALLPDLYAELLPEMDRPTAIPVWHVLDSELGLSLSPAPIEIIGQVLDETTEPRRGLRLCCHVLLNYAGDAKEPIQRIAALLNRLADWREDDLPWRDWSFVARSVIYNDGAEYLIDAILSIIERSPRWTGLERVAVALAQKADATEAAAVAAALMNRTEDASWRWADLLCVLFANQIPVPGLGEHAYRFLVVNPRADPWGNVFEALWRSRSVEPEEVQNLGLAWLGVRKHIAMPAIGSDAPGYDRVLGLIHSAMEGDLKAELTRLGLEWLRTSGPHTYGWSWLWPLFWDSDGMSEAERGELRDMALAWLGDSAEDPGWAFVWRPFFKNPGDTPIETLRALGMAWLTAVNPAHSGWNYVFELLWDAARDDAETRRVLGIVGDDWLLKRPDHRGWATVWDDIQRHDEAERLRRLEVGRAWLRQAAVSHPAWRVVGQAILPLVKPGDEDASQLARDAAKWLRTHLHDSFWVRIFRAGRDVLPAQDYTAVTAEILALVRKPKSRIGVGAVQAVLETCGDVAQEQELGDWLARRLSQDLAEVNWARAWITLVFRDPPVLEEDALLDLADAWLAANPEPIQQWSNLWPTWRHLLRKHNRIADLEHKSETSLAWLCGSTHRQRRWFDVWKALGKDRPDLMSDVHLVNAQARWLHGPIRDRGAWAQVLSAHRKVAAGWEADERLKSHVDQWLASATDDPLWADVWSAALVMVSDKDELCRKAAHRLETTLNWPAWIFVWKLAERNTRGRPVRKELLRAVEAILTASPVATARWVKVVEAVTARVRFSDAFLQQVSRDLTPIAKSALGRRITAALYHSRQTMRHLNPVVLAGTILEMPIHLSRFPTLWGDYLAVLTPESIDAALADKLIEWLEAAPKHASWPWIWRDVWKLSRAHRPQLSVMAKAWLASATPETQGYMIVRSRATG
ncbi:hypothetical protein, partial [Brevundimonas sp.]|uniref:P-loop NTPase n=1 Tax=Brevundimonas sp. TaxID=1871086 RepID=UPI0028A21657